MSLSGGAMPPRLIFCGSAAYGLLFVGDIYFVGKLAGSNDDWNWPTCGRYK